YHVVQEFFQISGIVRLLVFLKNLIPPGVAHGSVRYTHIVQGGIELGVTRSHAETENAILWVQVNGKTAASPPLYIKQGFQQSRPLLSGVDTRHQTQLIDGGIPAAVVDERPC